MLDQNTDRMWFVIGAVIVGAAIIFIANSLFPSMFDGITESFSAAVGRGTGVMNGLSPNSQGTPPGGIINLLSAIPFG